MVKRRATRKRGNSHKKGRKLASDIAARSAYVRARDRAWDCPECGAEDIHPSVLVCADCGHERWPVADIELPS